MNHKIYRKHNCEKQYRRIFNIERREILLVKNNIQGEMARMRESEIRHKIYRKHKCERYSIQRFRYEYSMVFRYIPN